MTARPVYSDALSSAEQDSQIHRWQQQASQLQELLQVMPNGVVVVDGQGKVKQANPVALELLGEPLEGESWRAIIDRAFKPRADDGHEISLYNGRRVKLSISPLSSEPGQLIVITDLTETRLLQERMGHLQKLGSLGKMVASLAHQIRTPLSAAMLYAANLANPTLSQPARTQFCERLSARLKDLESQVNDMLLFARSGEGQVVETLSLSSLIQSVQAGSAGLLKQSQAVLEVELPDPDRLIVGNQTALAGALQNLIHNAIQVIGKEARVTLSAKAVANEPNSIDLSVLDNGPGIAPELQNKVFEPFFTTKSQGTGLGLAVVKSVAQSHKGRVLVRNHQATEHHSGGCEIIIRLPVQKIVEQSQSLRSHA